MIGPQNGGRSARVIGDPYNQVINIMAKGDHIEAMTLEGPWDQTTWALPQDWALYDLSEEFVPQRVTFSDNYWEEHRRLSEQGKIKHDVEHCPERTQPMAVKMWDPQTGWSELKVPPLAGKASGQLASTTKQGH